MAMGCLTTGTTKGAAAERAVVRVCHVSLSLATGGLERLLADFARFHDRSRFELHYIAMDSAGRFADEIRECGCEVRLASSTGRLARIREMAALMRNFAPDIVHTHNTAPHIDGTLAAKIAGVPVVINTRHGQRIGHGRRSRWQYRLVGWGVDRIVGVSDDAARLTVEADGVPRRKVMRIWNGIDPERFAYRGPQKELVGISVGRLSAEKDVATLLRAVHFALKRVPELRLMVVGDGPERGALVRLSDELGIGGHVEFLGERKDVGDWLARAGFYVSSSLSEGVSLTLLEAMAVGLPVVATAAGGTPEVVEEGVTGRLVPVGDAAALGEAIVDLCGRKSEWEKLGRAGRRRVEENFEVRRMVAEYEELYEQLCEAKRGHKERRNRKATATRDVSRAGRI